MMYMGFGGLLNQLATTTAGGGMGAVVENYPIASGNFISAGDVVDIESGEVIGSKQPLSSFSPGDVVLLNENGTEVEFYVAKHDYESSLNGAGRTLVVRKDCYDQRQWNSDNVNAYASSAIDSWLNSTYKNMLEADIRSLIGTTKIRYTPGNGNWTVGTLERAIFALSLTELGQSYSYANTEGSALPIASTLKIAYQNGSPTYQWTRSPRTSGTNQTWGLSSSGDISGMNCTNINGSRPAFTLPGTYLAKDGSGQPNTQAIALQSGTAGQTIPVCYSGIVKAPFISQGDVISSSGVTGVGILDGVLQVYAKDRPGQVVTGSYVGTDVLENTITFPQIPKYIIITGRETNAPNNSGYIGFFTNNIGISFASNFNNSTEGSLVLYTTSGTSITLKTTTYPWPIANQADYTYDYFGIL